jgi:hypothetical protein
MLPDMESEKFVNLSAEKHTCYGDYSASFHHVAGVQGSIGQGNKQARSK